MSIQKIDVDVYCSNNTNNPIYRVYVDNDLLTERTFIWPTYEVFIREHIIVDIEPGHHQVRIVTPGHQQVYFKNVHLNNNLLPSRLERLQEFAFETTN